MIKLPPYLFFAGGFFSYASIFFTNPVLTMFMSVVGMTLSLYIWYILAWNRDRHLARMREQKYLSEREVEEYKIAKNSRLWVVVYSVSFISMNISGLFVLKAILDNVDITAQTPQIDELIAMLGASYIFFSWLFFLSGIATVFLYGKLIMLLYNDEMKIQTLESRRRKIPVIISKPLSILFMLLFTLITYGLFSWFMRYRLASFQKFHHYMEKKMNEMNETLREEASQAQTQSPEVLEDKLLEKYSASLDSAAASEKRKEIIALLFKDLGDLNSDQAKQLLETLLARELLTQGEFKRLTSLLI